MKKLTYLLPLLFGFVQGFFDIETPYIEDLTTSQGINKTESEGFDLRKPPYHIYFNVATDLAKFNRGYSWAVDGSRCGGFL